MCFQLLCEKKHLFPVILDFIKHKLHHPSNSSTVYTLNAVLTGDCSLLQGQLLRVSLKSGLWSTSEGHRDCSTCRLP